MQITRTVLVVVICGCGGGETPTDAPVISDGRCGAELDFTGEIVDWDATDAMFCGVFGATLSVDADPTRADTTNPNGRFELCIPRAATVKLDLAPPASASGCSAGGAYSFPGIVIADQRVIATGKQFSARMIGMARAAALFDPTKAVVFVHSEGVVRPVTSSAAHGAALAWDGAQWMPGDSGINVVFPDTETASGVTEIGVSAGSATGTGSVPVKPGTFTYVTIVGN